ncbi:MAG TPA: hypothetical protein VGV69_07845 [Solirubrobacterales bacterium]|nr:hypothetical protein [Solirubrobacterales bacterium]
MRQMRNSGVVFALCLSAIVLGLSPSAGGQERFKTVLLDEGRLPSYRWGMLAHRDAGREGGRRPCVLVVIYQRASWGVLESDDKVCGPLPRGGPPVISSYTFDGNPRDVTVFALAFEPRVASVALDLGEAGRRQVHLHVLNPRQSDIARLRPFRFQTFAIRGEFCLGEIVGYSSSDEEIYRDSPRECPI